jgi:hypothetical protein
MYQTSIKGGAVDNFRINGRHGFLFLTTSVGAGLLLSECTRTTPSTPEGERRSNSKNEEEVSPAEDGFERIVNEVVGIEKRMGIDNLVQFTPLL